VPIQHYVEVNFKTFRDLVNAIGTVPVLFPAPAKDDFSLLDVPYPGCVNLDGQGALAFVRARHLQVLDPNGKWISPDPIPDIGRIARQQALLRVIGKEALNAALSNPFTANDVADAAIKDLKLDQDFGRTDVFVVADGLGGAGDRGGPVSETVPTEPATRDGQSVLLPTSAAEAMIAQLRDFTTVITASTTAAPSPSTAARAPAARTSGSPPGAASAHVASAPPNPSPLAPIPGGC
jgi:anionic cell wall polymer biosynthesis LytR-Cps2A-Psr (LCP) family protein